MKLIIDIPYEMYDVIKKDTESEMYIIHVIKNGIPYEERPQGKWITRTEDNGINYRFYCSCCGREVKQITEFCPNCGANMKGGEDED